MAWREEEWTEFDCVNVVATTDKALLCEIEGDEYWIPRSQINVDECDLEAAGDHGRLVITQWLAMQKKLL